MKTDLTPVLGGPEEGGVSWVEVPRHELTEAQRAAEEDYAAFLAEREKERVSEERKRWRSRFAGGCAIALTVLVLVVYWASRAGILAGDGRF